MSVLFPFFDFESERDVLEHVHVFEQRVILENKTDISLLHRDVVRRARRE